MGGFVRLPLIRQMTPELKAAKKVEAALDPTQAFKNHMANCPVCKPFWFNPRSEPGPCYQGSCLFWAAISGNA